MLVISKSAMAWTVIPAYLDHKVGDVVSHDQWQGEQYLWKLYQISPSGSPMFYMQHRPFVIAVRPHERVINRVQGASVFDVVKGCMKYLGPSQMKNLQGFDLEVRVYEMTECK